MKNFIYPKRIKNISATTFNSVCVNGVLTPWSKLHSIQCLTNLLDRKFEEKYKYFRNMLKIKMLFIKKNYVI